MNLTFKENTLAVLGSVGQAQDTASKGQGGPAVQKAPGTGEGERRRGQAVALKGQGHPGSYQALGSEAAQPWHLCRTLGAGTMPLQTHVQESSGKEECW